MKKIRIAFIIELYGTPRQGGEQEALFALAERLRQYEDLHIEIYSYSGVQSQKVPFPLPRAMTFAPYVRDLCALPKLGRFIAKTVASKADIVHASSPTLFSFSSCSSAYVHSIHSIPSERARELSRVPKYRFLPLRRAAFFLEWLERRGLAKAQQVIVLKHATKEYVNTHLGVEGSKLVRIPNPVDTEHFTPATTLGDSILFVGRPSSMKGIDTLLAAAPKIHAPLILVSPRISPTLKKQAESLGIEVHERVDHAEMPRYYQRARIFCLPSWKEDQPLSVLEAMATGVPSIVTPSAAADLIEHGTHGLIIPPGDTRALANAVNELYNDPSRCQTYGQASRAKALAEHSWAVVLEQHHELYTRLFRERTSSS